MAETVPSSNEPTAGVPSTDFNRLRRLTFISLSLNALILFLIVAGAVIHHHNQKYQRFAGRDGYGGGRFSQQCQMDFARRFHRFDGMGMNRRWGRPDGFRGDRDGGGDRFRGPGAYGGGPGPGPGMPNRPGMPGMMGGAGNGPPDPAQMADGILNHLSAQLSLTDDEKAKIKPIIEQQVAQIQKQMEAQRQALQKQIEDAKTKIKPLLTADQQKQLDAMPLPGQKPAPDQATQPAPKPGQ